MRTLWRSKPNGSSRIAASTICSFCPRRHIEWFGLVRGT